MAAFSEIAWTHHTHNPWWGCEKIDPECLNCYAKDWDHRFPIEGQRHWGKDAPRRFFGDKKWREPLKWAKAARELGERHRVFCASMGDVFEDRRDLDAARAQLWELIKATPELDWLLLTKRPDVARRLLPWVQLGEPPKRTERGACSKCGGFEDLCGCFSYVRESEPWPNVWLGTSAGTMKSLYKNATQLLQAPAALRFLSMEPLLEEVDIPRDWLQPFHELDPMLKPTAKIDWVIVGGESDNGGSVKNVRPMAVRWARRVLRQCQSTETPFFMKQLGSKLDAIDSLEVGKLKHKKGGDPDEWPEDLRVREFPRAA